MGGIVKSDLQYLFEGLYLYSTIGNRICIFVHGLNNQTLGWTTLPVKVSPVKLKPSPIQPSILDTWLNKWHQSICIFVFICSSQHLDCFEFYLYFFNIWQRRLQSKWNLSHLGLPFPQILATSSPVSSKMVLPGAQSSNCNNCIKKFNFICNCWLIISSLPTVQWKCQIKTPTVGNRVESELFHFKSEILEKVELKESWIKSQQ